jgi:hypothetical protein
MAIALQLMVGPSAHAGTVSMGAGGGVSKLMFVASSGETNRVAIRTLGYSSTPPYDPSWLVIDTGAPITPGESCTVASKYEARCTLSGESYVYRFRASLGDGDDSFRAAPPVINGPDLDSFVKGGSGDDRLYGDASSARVALRGGPGDDRLYGGTSSDALRGGPGEDRLYGGASSDALRGGGGHDRLYGNEDDDRLIDDEPDGSLRTASLAADRFDGGPGDDQVSYYRRIAPVRVDLGDRRPDGAPGEGDVLVDVESIAGGHGSDRLAGDDGPNTLDGRGGRDRLIGRGGDDSLWFGGGLTSCGAGSDRVGAARFGDAPPRRDRELEDLARDCETADFGYPLSPLPVYPTHLHGRVMSYKVSCPVYFNNYYEEDLALACSGQITLNQAYGQHLLLAHATFPRGRWSSRPVTVRLTPLGRRLAHRDHGVKATLTVSADRRLFPLRWMIRLKTPPIAPKS